jgi:hypothetical protein
LTFIYTAYAVTGGSDEDRSEIVLEIENILQRWIEQDRLKANSQLLLLVPVKESEARDEDDAQEMNGLGGGSNAGGDQDLNSTSSLRAKLIHHDEEVFQYRVTQEVFSVFDHLFRAVRMANRQAGLIKASAGRVRPSPNNTIQPCLSEEEALCIGNMLKRIPLVSFTS